MEDDESDSILDQEILKESESLVSCYECTDRNSDCGIKNTTLKHGCQSCMVYRNAFDDSKSSRTS